MHGLTGDLNQPPFHPSSSRLSVHSYPVNFKNTPTIISSQPLCQVTGHHTADTTLIRPPSSGHSYPATLIQPLIGSLLSGHPHLVTLIRPPSSGHSYPATLIQRLIRFTLIQPPSSGHTVPVQLKFMKPEVTIPQSIPTHQNTAIAFDRKQQQKQKHAG